MCSGIHDMTGNAGRAFSRFRAVHRQGLPLAILEVMRAHSLPLLLCLLVVTAPVGARMYEWVNPDSGRVQLSGEPPSWYRAPAPGPRVRVFDNGTLVDDTAIALSAEENAALREFALARVQQRRKLDALRELELAAARDSAQREAAALDAERQAELEQRREESAAEADETGAEDGTTVPATAAAAEDLLPSALDEQTIERFKQIIREFDNAAGVR